MIHLHNLPESCFPTKFRCWLCSDWPWRCGTSICSNVRSVAFCTGRCVGCSILVACLSLRIQVYPKGFPRTNPNSREGPGLGFWSFSFFGVGTTSNKKTVYIHGGFCQLCSMLRGRTWPTPWTKSCVFGGFYVSVTGLYIIPIASTLFVWYTYVYLHLPYKFTKCR